MFEENSHVSSLAAGVIGGVVGGLLGVLGTAVSAYYGPRRLEEWRREKRREESDEPRMRLLRLMLEDERFPVKSLDRLRIVTGTTDEECRRLLINAGARGVLLKGNREGWALIKTRPLDGVYKSDATDDD